jgi:addiction module HigA family antidote
MMDTERKRRPTHPGEILREEVLPALGMTQGEFAAWIGVSRRTVNEILQEKRPVTVDTAHRLARALNTSPDVWLGLQQEVELWETMQANKSVYERIKPLKAA